MPRLIEPASDQVASPQEINEAIERAAAFGCKLTNEEVRQIADGTRGATEHEARAMALLVIQNELLNSRSAYLLEEARSVILQLVSIVGGGFLLPTETPPSVH